MITSLKSKMVVATLLLTAGILTVTGFFTLLYFENRFKEMISEQNFTLITAQARDIDSKIENAHRMLIAVAGVLPPAILRDSDRAQLWLDNRTGIKSIFDNGLFIWNGSGRLVVESPYLPDRRGTYYGDVEFVRETLRAGRPFISHPHKAKKGLHHPAIVMTAPVRDIRGRIVAILGGSIDLLKENFLSSVAEIRVGRSGYLYLFDDEREIISHPDRSRVLQAVPPGANRMIDDALTGYEGTRENMTPEGLHALSSLKKLRTRDWFLAADYPVSEAYASVRTARRYFYPILGIALAATIVTVWFVMKRITAPLLEFARHVQHLSAKTGQERLVPVRFEDETGRLARAFNAMIQELDRQHEALRRSEEQYRAFIESSLDGVYFADADGIFRQINSAGAAILGHASPREVIGRPAADYWNDRSERERFVEELMQKKSVRAFMIHGRRADGNQMYVEATSRLVQDRGDGIAGIEGILRDTTERVRAEQELAQKNRELEEAYHDLKAAQSRILQQEKMASIGQLAAGVAHEINNPIGFIMSNLGSLRKYTERISDFLAAQSQAVNDLANDAARASDILHGLEEKKKALRIDFILQDVRALVRESLNGAARVKRIVQDFKSFSHVDQAERKQADINDCIESTLNIVWNELKYKAKLIRDLGDIPPTVCNPGQLNQVFVNLLVNAAQAIEEQGEISIRTRREERDIVIEIADTGRGIPPEIRDRIFEPFFTTKEVGQGTGLGLSITYDIVKKHNGDISVRSEPGKGAAFTVRIPVVGCTDDSKEAL